MPACAADVDALRIWAGPEYTRAVFDVSGAIDYKLFELSDPDRIVLDLEGSAFVRDFDVPQVKGLLKRIRTGKHGKDGVRVVFDLDKDVRPKSFLLQPAERFGYRLVLDLYPKVASAPVRTLADTPAGTSRNVVVALDAGHGGDDPGATGPSGTHEKTITLAVARELKKLIDREPGMAAVLTRDGDYFIPLKERYRKARKAKADLFVSIHADAYTSSDARGSSVWVLSPRGATSEAARWLADRENRADLVGGVSLDDKDDTLAAVLLDLSQGATMEASNAVAGRVLAALRRLGPTHRGYVEHANFVVLRSPDVPSILVETAFITNPAEEKRLKSPRQREQIAEAVLGGVRNYFENTPPPGSWFAARARRPGEGQVVASAARTPSTGFAGDLRDLHKVARGETLSGIAQQYGVSLGTLRAANRLTDDGLRAGDILQIPPGT
ncbi:MAG TPA: N-acetylmuramoyl-L-alanine amidase [Rhodanobacteraceae bacterium]|nr:N-acetylmuramoyl-L-alanine amidase [Rhodanobacteraceae bacterium]